MNKTLIIVGAGGHGRVVADIAVARGTYSDIAFLDDSAALDPRVIGKVSDYKKYVLNCDFIVAVGNNAVRERIARELQSGGAALTTLIHPSVSVGSDVKIGKGSVVMAGAVLNNGATIGDGVIINTCASVDHDCIVSDFCHISVGAHLAGTVGVGKRCFVCAGATVINNIDICDDCTVGAGAVVIRNITEKGVYIGIPAELI